MREGERVNEDGNPRPSSALLLACAKLEDLAHRALEEHHTSQTHEKRISFPFLRSQAEGLLLHDLIQTLLLLQETKQAATASGGSASTICGQRITPYMTESDTTTLAPCLVLT